jgi:hypothetical protein
MKVNQLNLILLVVMGLIGVSSRRRVLKRKLNNWRVVSRILSRKPKSSFLTVWLQITTVVLNLMALSLMKKRRRLSLISTSKI